MYLLNEKSQVKGLVVFLLVFALLITGCVGPLVNIACAGGPSVAEQLGINNEKEPEALEEIPEIPEKEIDLIGEDIDLRSKYIKQFVREDKAVQAVIYEQAVHYEEDGVFKDIDNTLVLNRGEKGAEVYRNKDNGYYNVSLNPNENTKGDTILMEREGGSLSWKLVSVNTGEKGPLTRESGEKAVEILSNGTAERKAAASRNEQMTMLENLTAGARYSNVYKGVSLEYFMMPEKVKENIVLDSYINNAEFVFNLSMTNLDAKQREDGMIVLINTKTGEEVFYIEAPYMIDAQMEYSTDVKMTLVQDGDKTQLVITPSDEWIKKAAYPVKIDPTVVTQINETNVDDAYCSEGYPTTEYGAWSILKVGEGSSSQTNFSFIKFINLPVIDSSHMVVDARLNLYLWQNNDEDNVQVNVHKVLENWNENDINWSNMPDHNSIIEDYEIVSSIDTGYSWEITDIAREWYQTGNNFGLMVRETPNDNDYIEFYSAEGWGSITMPYSTITYVSNAGLESYWTYHSQSAGRAGTGNVNDYNGNLIWVHNDLSINGNRMPVSLSHVFNSCYKGYDHYLGYGWRLNYSQRLNYETISGVGYYAYTDADGTKHYFFNDNGTWRVESGLDLTLHWDGSYWNITDKSNNVLKFDGAGEFKSIVDSNGNTQQLNYTSGMLSSIVDGAGRTTYLYYNGTGGKLSEIKDPSNRSTHFYYDANGRLQYIQYPDHTSTNFRKTQFSYNGNGDLIQAKSFDGYEINYNYSNAQPHRVISINEKNAATNGGQLTLSYGGNRTTYTDGSGREEYLHFDDYGRTVGGVNDHGQGVYYKYHSGTNDINNNKVTSVSKMQDTVVNLAINGGGEESKAWEFGSSVATAIKEYSTDQKYLGNRSIKLSQPQTTGYTYALQFVSLQAGKTYTFSGYIKTSNILGAGASLIIAYCDSQGVWNYLSSERVTGTTDWKRYSITFTVPTDVSCLKIKIQPHIHNASGTAWFDSLQLEEGAVANKYNLIENGDFEYGTTTPNSWTMCNSDGNEALEMQSSTDHPKELGTKAFKMIGNPSKDKRMYYGVNVRGNAGDVFICSGWAKANAMPFNGNRSFAIHAVINYSDGTWSYEGKEFNHDTSDWQYMSFPIVPQKDYVSIYVHAVYYKQENTAYFDGFSLFKESFGQSYAYDSNGNITSATDLADKQSSFDFNSNNDLIKLTTPKGNEFEYTYDSNHNVTRAETAKGVDYSFTYDSYGNNTSSKVYDASGANSGFIKANAAYDSNGNYINTVTDARGKVTDYDYHSSKGILTRVEDAVGNVVRYSYDSYIDRLNYVWLDLDEDGVWDSNEPKNTYTYVGDRLDKVTVNGFNYDFDYDALGNLDIVKVESQTLINNDYNLSKGLLTNSTYGNSGSVTYTYDNLDRVSTVNYDGSAVEFEYFYDANGMIGYMVDNENGVEYRYLYDEANRPGSIVRDNGITSWYKYDDNLSAPTTTEYFYESISANNDTYETEYKSDEDGRPTSTIISVDGSTDYKVGYSYDYLSRPTSKKYYTGTTQEYKEEYTYLAGGQGANSTTTLVSQIEYNDTDTVEYDYDDVGNISTITDGTNVIQYYYDGLNQLVRENNPIISKTILYTYDNGGNIDVIKEYALTVGTATPTTLLNTIDYTYDGTWDDKLASYDGKSITYDSIGNPLSYDDWTYTWKWGRRLATVGNTSKGISTSYKYNDSGIRTQKTVTDNGNTTTYKYNLMGSKITYEERTGANACEMYYAYDNAGKLYGFYYDGASSDGFYFYKRNLQGDIIGIINSSGTEVTSYIYDAWGKLVSKTGSLASTVGADNPFRYRGYYYDDETGLYYLNQRYYNPEWRRFINADNFMGQTGGLLTHNVFAYCGNNPVMFSDPSGYVRSFNTLVTDSGAGRNAKKWHVVKNLNDKQKSFVMDTIKEVGMDNVQTGINGSLSIQNNFRQFTFIFTAEDAELLSKGFRDLSDSITEGAIWGAAGGGVVKLSKIKVVESAIKALGPTVAGALTIGIVAGMGLGAHYTGQVASGLSDYANGGKYSVAMQWTIPLSNGELFYNPWTFPGY